MTPTRACPAGRRKRIARIPCAQRHRAAACCPLSGLRSAGQGGVLEEGITISLPSRRCDSNDRSAVARGAIRRHASKGDARSVLAQFGQAHHLEPAGIRQIGLSQFMKRCSPPSRGQPFGPGLAASGDRCCPAGDPPRRPPRFGQPRLERAAVPTGMRAGVRDIAARLRSPRARAAPSGGIEWIKGKA